MLRQLHYKNRFLKLDIYAGVPELKQHRTQMAREGKVNFRTNGMIRDENTLNEATSKKETGKADKVLVSRDINE